MSTKRKATRPVIRRSREEKGDVSNKVLHRTIVVCLIGLVAVYLFAFAPKNGGTVTSAAPGITQAESREAVSRFDRESLSTKSR